MYYLTHVRDLVRQFVETGRTFFFLTYHKEIMGLVTTLNLPSRPCHLYFYNLVNDLELRLGDFVGRYVRNRFIEDFLQKKESEGHTKSRASQILEKYHADKAKNQDSNLIEYLYFTHFAELIQAQKLTTYLGFSSTRQLEQATTRINEIRNWVAHPVSSSTANLSEMLQAFLQAYDTFIEGFQDYESKQELIQAFRETAYLIHTHKKGPRQEIIIKVGEEIRLAFYKAVMALLRTYSTVANEMDKLGYTETEAQMIKDKISFYGKLRETIRRASGDYVDLKAYEPGMRQLMDMYIDAKASKKTSDFENTSLVDLIVNVMKEDAPEYGTQKNREAVAETIENNVRKAIIAQSETNPVFYEKMSTILTELIRRRKEEAMEYEAYLEKIKELAEQMTGETTNRSEYPSSLQSEALRNLYDNLERDEVLVLALDNVIQANMLDGWKENMLKERKLRMAVLDVLKDEQQADHIMKIIKAQREY
ncbi:MAG: hypothetical protein AAFP89_14095 [Bacteroidota bacterium]